MKVAHVLLFAVSVSCKGSIKGKSKGFHSTGGIFGNLGGYKGSVSFGFGGFSSLGKFPGYLAHNNFNGLKGNGGYYGSSWKTPKKGKFSKGLSSGTYLGSTYFGGRLDDYDDYIRGFGGIHRYPGYIGSRYFSGRYSDDDDFDDDVLDDVADVLEEAISNYGNDEILDDLLEEYLLDDISDHSLFELLDGLDDYDGDDDDDYDDNLLEDFFRFRRFGRLRGYRRSFRYGPYIRRRFRGYRRSPRYKGPPRYGRFSKRPWRYHKCTCHKKCPKYKVKTGKCKKCKMCK